jgi:autotransporter-associated beta strand protein
VTGTQLTIAGQISGVAYDYVKTGGGRLVLSGNNTYTGRTLINAGMLQVTSTGNLGANANNLVIAAGATLDLQTALTVGSLNMVTGANITNSVGVSGLTVNGISNVAGNITTAGNQTFNDEVRLVGTTTIQSTAGNLSFEATITAPNNTKSSRHSLAVLAAGTITFNREIGVISSNIYSNLRASGNVYNLAVTASTIYINADISTIEEQVYNGAVIIGGVTPVRTLLSLDPLIRFNGTVDDAVANTHTLIVRAVSVSLNPGTPAEVPKIIFDKAVGATSPLFELQAITGVQSLASTTAGDIDVEATIASPTDMIGRVIVRESVTATEKQTYVANRIDMGGPEKTILTSKRIDIHEGGNLETPEGYEGGFVPAENSSIEARGKLNKPHKGIKVPSKGGYVEAALATIQSKSASKIFLEREARVVVGAALKMKDGKISSFNETAGDIKSNASKKLTTDCMKDNSEECQK